MFFSIFSLTPPCVVQQIIIKPLVLQQQHVISEQVVDAWSMFGRCLLLCVLVNFCFTDVLALHLTIEFPGVT